MNLKTATIVALVVCALMTILSFLVCLLFLFKGKGGEDPAMAAGGLFSAAIWGSFAFFFFCFKQSGLSTYALGDVVNTPSLPRTKPEPVIEEDILPARGNSDRTDPGSTRVCPRCQRWAGVSEPTCKFCGHDFQSPRVPAMSPPPQQPQQKFQPQPQFQRPAKSRSTYVLLGLFLGGPIGIHNFYAGRYSSAVAQLLIMIFLGWVIIGVVINVIWVLIEVLAVKTDGHGNRMT